MKSTRQQTREARRLFRTCLVQGALDEDRVRGIVTRTIDRGGVGALKVLSRLQRLVRLDREAHQAKVESATTIPPDIRASIESGLHRLYGGGVVTSYAENQALLGGVRITVGSDVYDGTIQGQLAAIEENL